MLRFQAEIYPDLTHRNDGHQRCPCQVEYGSDGGGQVSVDVGGTPGSGILNGSVWHDADFDNSLDSGELRLRAGR